MRCFVRSSTRVRGALAGLAAALILTLGPAAATRAATPTPKPTATPASAAATAAAKQADAAKKGAAAKAAAAKAAAAKADAAKKAEAARQAEAAKNATPPGRIPGAWFVAVALGALLFNLLLRRAYAKTATDPRQKDVVTNLATLYVLGLASTPFLPLSGSDWVVLDFVALAVSLGAGFFGFLFGLPHAITQTGTSTEAGAPMVTTTPASRAVLRPSTNLESVADQLTKFITGAAFASIAVAAGYIKGFGALVQGALTGTVASGALLGDMLFVAYGALGFTIAYIVTRTDLTASFQQSDQALLSEGSMTFDFILPDVRAGDATDEQRALAKKIAAVSFDTAQTKEQRLSWARAQTIMGELEKARAAYAGIYADAYDDPAVTIEYATALYNDPSFKKPKFILALIGDAEKALIPKPDPGLSSRAAALKAATNLYIPDGGYVETISIVNAQLKSGAATSNNMRFYRACAFGQMYRAWRDAGMLQATDTTEITNRIFSDTKISLSYDAKSREDFKNVVSPPPDSPDDDDLQAFAADDPTYAPDVLKTSKPNLPDANREGKPTVAPLPAGATPGSLAKDSPT